MQHDNGQQEWVKTSCQCWSLNFQAPDFLGFRDADMLNMAEVSSTELYVERVYLVVLWKMHCRRARERMLIERMVGLIRWKLKFLPSYLTNRKCVNPARRSQYPSLQLRTTTMLSPFSPISLKAEAKYKEPWPVFCSKALREARNWRFSTL